ncbi:MAG: terminase large subunit [Sphingomonas sp.]
MTRWDFACPDWETRLRDGRSLVPDLPLDEAAARKAIGMFNKLRLPDVDGKPAMAEAAGDWFRAIVGAVFGSVDREGIRRVGEVFALVPKKQSKTTGGAGIMLTGLIENRAPRQEFLFVGPTQEIAQLAFDQAAGMIEADDEGYLKKRFSAKDHIKTIVDLTNGSTLKIKTFDMRVMTGAKPKAVLVDELHIMSTLSYASKVMRQIRGGLAVRSDSFLIIITTQSDEPPSGCFKADLMMARGIRDGRVTGDAARMLPILYEFPEAMQTDPERPWADPANWPMVLPNLGRSIQIERLQEEFASAQEKGADEVRGWASQHLNVEIGLGLHSSRWRGADFWELAAEPKLGTLETFLGRCDVIVAGIDGGGLDDLFGLALAGREKGTGRWLYWCRAWVWRDVLALRPEIAGKLEDFAQDGDLVICDVDPSSADIDAVDEEDALQTIEQDVAAIVAILEKVKEAGLFPEKNAVGLDPQGVGALVDALAAIGLEHPQVVAVSQGFRLSSAVWSMERKLKHRMLAHAGSRMMNWCVGNAKAEQRGNAVLITKETAGKAKIDPLVACFNATKLLEMNPEAAGAGGAESLLASLRKAA